LTQLIVLWPINYCQDPRTLNVIQTTITVLSLTTVANFPVTCRLLSGDV